MAGVRKTSPAAARQSAMVIVRALRAAGHTAYFAGGCVRDELLGLSPTDYDIATDATPDRLRTLFRRTNEVGAAFGVVLVTATADEGAPEPATVEVATFRADGPYSDRRRPDIVTFSDPESDAKRRDFTVNALFLDPDSGIDLPVDIPDSQTDQTSSGSSMPRARGKVIDFVGGREDLARKLIRAVGDPEARLAEDHLRALRAVRFTARLGFELDPSTAQAIHRHARDLQGVSRERIGDEVRRMLLHSRRAAAVQLLESLSLDSPVLEETEHPSRGPALAGLPSDIGDTGYPTCLAAWACDRGLTLEATAIRELAYRWRKALCLSNEEHQALRDTITALAELETSWQSLTTARQKRLAGSHPGFEPALLLLQGRNPAARKAVDQRVGELSETHSGLRPEPLITGDDLIAAGRTPGPAFKQLLEVLYDAQLEDRVKTRAEALELAQRMGV